MCLTSSSFRYVHYENLTKWRYDTGNWYLWRILESVHFLAITSWDAGNDISHRENTCCCRSTLVYYHTTPICWWIERTQTAVRCSYGWLSLRTEGNTIAVKSLSTGMPGVAWKSLQKSHQSSKSLENSFFGGFISGISEQFQKVVAIFNPGILY